MRGILIGERGTGGVSVEGTFHYQSLAPFVQFPRFSCTLSYNNTLLSQCLAGVHLYTHQGGERGSFSTRQLQDSCDVQRLISTLYQWEASRNKPFFFVWQINSLLVFQITFKFRESMKNFEGVKRCGSLQIFFSSPFSLLGQEAIFAGLSTRDPSLI